MEASRRPIPRPTTGRSFGTVRLADLRRPFVRIGVAGAIAVLGTVAGSALAARAATDSSYQVLVGDGSTGTVFVIAAGSTSATAIPPPIASGVASLTVSRDGSRVYVAFKDGMLGTISTASDSYVGVPLDLGSASAPGQMVVTPDSSDLYVAETGANQVVEVDTSSNSLVRSPVAIAAPVNLALTPDGATLFVDGGSQTAGISVLATSDNTLNPTTIAVAAPEAMAISPDGTSLYVLTDSSSGTAITMIDTSTDAVGSGVALSTQDQPANLALAPGGSALYVTDGAAQSLYVLGMTYFDPSSSSPPAPSGLALGFTPGALAITPEGGTAYLDGTTSNNTPEVVAVDLASSTLASPVALPASAQPSGLVIAQVAATATPTPTPTPNPSPTPTPSPTCSPLPLLPLDPGPVSVPPNQPAPASSPSAQASSGRSGTGSVAGSAATPTVAASPTSATAPSKGTFLRVGTNTPTPDPSPNFCCGVGIGVGSSSGGPITAVATPIDTPPGMTSPPATADSPVPVVTTAPAPATPTPTTGTRHLPILCFAPVVGGPAFPGAAALTRGVADPVVAGGPILPAALALLGLGGVGVVVGARRRGFLIRRGRAA
ncbi:MAG TPA: YncE family protein [Candidatus Saccharimonadales bacterium]|nr:YncE family protein [Candidatus Saccharimonadales bacterium]